MSRREQLEQLLQSDPEDTFLNYALALAYVAEGRRAEGLDRLAQVIQRDPDYVAAYFQRGQLLAENGDTEAARDIVQQGVVVARRVGDAHAAAEMSGFLETL